jgi:hypothetical protein
MLTAVRCWISAGLRCNQAGRTNGRFGGFSGSMDSRLKDFAQQISAHYLTRVQATPHFSTLPSGRQAMKYRIVHKTAYRYSEPASLSQNELFLHPRETGTQRVIQSRLTIMPEPQYLHRRTDYFGNIAHVFMVQQPHDELGHRTVSMVETCLPVLPAPDRHRPGKPWPGGWPPMRIRRNWRPTSLFLSAP